MTDLKKLNVSLTKHGTHKLAALFDKYDTLQILDHLRESGETIERAQAKKTLAADLTGRVPDFWNEARSLGDKTVNALMLVAIIFSHHELIAVMQESGARVRKPNVVERKRFTSEKAFTNLKRIFSQLGYATDADARQFSYSLSAMFSIPSLNKLVTQLLTQKLTDAGWDRKNTLIDEASALNLQRVFGISKDQFAAWLSTGDLEGEIEAFEDEDFFKTANDDIPVMPFVFEPGHHGKKTGSVSVRGSSKSITATLLHNEIQNQLVESLQKKYGIAAVRSEQPTGQNTSIDVVLRVGKSHWFYEIKTATSVKGCIRQAIPQLLEYAYWHGVDDRAERLIIVSTLKPTRQSETYLKFLRDRFGVAIYYESITLKKATRGKT